MFCKWDHCDKMKNASMLVIVCQLFAEDIYWIMNNCRDSFCLHQGRIQRILVGGNKRAIWQDSAKQRFFSQFVSLLAVSCQTTVIVIVTRERWGIQRCFHLRSKTPNSPSMTLLPVKFVWNINYRGLQYKTILAKWQ